VLLKLFRDGKGEDEEATVVMVLDGEERRDEGGREWMREGGGRIEDIVSK
jgi:hypothetical protein